MKLLGTLLLFGLLFAAPMIAQDNTATDQMVYGAHASAKYIQLPVLPKCASFAVERGDPNTGPADLLLRASTGCKIPWHWHTATETLYFVSGRARVEMRGESSHVAEKSDYVYMPAKQPHQFTCLASCSLFLATSAAFDIHYVDAEGNEIKPEEALKTSASAHPEKKSMP
jgi:mannose-6-phosphate isomerase-like protein (cupin superfamily)